MNANGSGVARLTTSLGSEWGPAWSPDGRRIAFRSDRDGNIEIYTMNADGTGQVNITNSSVTREFSPSWGP